MQGNFRAPAQQLHSLSIVSTLCAVVQEKIKKTLHAHTHTRTHARAHARKFKNSPAHLHNTQKQLQENETSVQEVFRAPAQYIFSPAHIGETPVNCGSICAGEFSNKMSQPLP